MNITVSWDMTPCAVVHVKEISVENAVSILRKMEPGGSKMRGLKKEAATSSET
jgi:hypothetical protein